MQTFEISKNGILRDKDRIKNRIDVDVQDTFLCVQNINKRRIYLSLFELGHFSCQFNAKRVRLYLAKWASCDNRARWSFQIRRSHCLVHFRQCRPPGILQTPEYTAGDAFFHPFVSFYFPQSLSFSKIKDGEHKHSANWVFVRTKNTP